MQNNSNRCPFCAEKDLRIDGTCTHTPTGSPSTPPPAEMCPQCGEAERHAFECPVSVASREEFNAALREYVPKSAEPAALCLECDREQRIGKCPHKPAKAPQLSQAECEKVYAESQADIADLIKPAAAEVPKTVSLRDAFAITIKMFSELREKHDALKAERARYRKALEHIHEESAGWAAMIARKALEARDGK